MADDSRNSTLQIVGEFFKKVGQIVLQNRLLPNQISSPKVSNKWFNLETDEVDQYNSEISSLLRSNLASPLIIDVLVESMDREKIMIESWKISFEGTQQNDVELTPSYKKLIVLIRELYLFVRILPAYKLCRKCKRNNMSSKLSYRLSRFEPAPQTGFFKSADFAFKPITLPVGRLSVTVSYLQDVSFQDLVASEKIINSHVIIPDYLPQVPTSKTKPIGIPSQTTAYTFSSDGGLETSSKISPNRTPNEGGSFPGKPTTRSPLNRSQRESSFASPSGSAVTLSTLADEKDPPFAFRSSFLTEEPNEPPLALANVNSIQDASDIETEIGAFVAQCQETPSLHLISMVPQSNEVPVSEVLRDLKSFAIN